MDGSFEVKVTNITAQEYVSAVRRLQARPNPRFAALIVLIFAVLIFIGDKNDLMTYVLPFIAVAFILVYLEFKRWQDYSKFPKALELHYEIDAQGWRLRVKNETSSCSWASTVKLVETKHVFLLYNSKTASNLLPKRCLTEEQIGLIRTWYKNRFQQSSSGTELES